MNDSCHSSWPSSSHPHTPHKHSYSHRELLPQWWADSWEDKEKLLSSTLTLRTYTLDHQSGDCTQALAGSWGGLRSESRAWPSLASSAYCS